MREMPYGAPLFFFRAGFKKVNLTRPEGGGPAAKT
jgi:hypothetical protein